MRKLAPATLDSAQLSLAKLAATHGTGPAPTPQRPIRDLPRTGHRKAAVRTRTRAPRRTY
ncbi:hypothetical protein [Streptomyces sp. NPDC053427]|uniref:hypothetical protein n=1 Tax=Streptomyces sp. NPDC053427 TaxID=3365701 RepID=UPI0037D93E24